MTVARGREFLSIPGPTNIPDAVLAAMHRPAVDIYSGPLLDVTRSLFEDLLTHQPSITISTFHSWFLQILQRAPLDVHHHRLHLGLERLAELLQRLEALAKERYVPPYYVAAVHVAMGDHPHALDLLEQAHDEHSHWLVFLAVEPMFTQIREEPRFQDLLRRVGLKPAR